MQMGRKRYLIDIIIETICSCRDDPGENVQLQVMKALLTIVSSNVCRTHGESLLLAVRACYHIYLVSKNPVNRSTAKASLTQILSIVFQRMESQQNAVDPAAITVSVGAGSGSADGSASGHEGGLVSPTAAGGLAMPAVTSGGPEDDGDAGEGDGTTCLCGLFPSHSLSVEITFGSFAVAQLRQAVLHPSRQLRARQLAAAVPASRLRLQAAVRRQQPEPVLQHHRLLRPWSRRAMAPRHRSAALRPSSTATRFCCSARCASCP